MIILINLDAEHGTWCTLVVEYQQNLDTQYLQKENNNSKREC